MTVNQKALVTKILARYATDFFVLKELIQNADDAQSTEVTIDLTTDKREDVAPALRAQVLAGAGQSFSALAVRNSGGRLFDDAGWERIVEIATGNPDENSVGHFGVGFYSVFAASDRPRIHSGRYMMQFSWAGQVLEAERQIVPEQQAEECTSVTLELKQQAEARRWELPKLSRFLARSLCFLRHVQRLELRVDQAVHVGFTRTEEAEANPLYVGPGLTSHRGLFFVRCVEQRWLSIEATHAAGREAWHGNAVSVQLETNPACCEDVNTGIAQVIGKRPVQVRAACASVHPYAGFSIGTLVSPPLGVAMIQHIHRRPLLDLA